MAAQEIIANLAAQVRRLMAEHAKLRGLCDRMKTEGDALRKENRTLQERVRSLEDHGHRRFPSRRGVHPAPL